MNISALDVAHYFLFLKENENVTELISNLKVQKLLYYAQGFYLAENDKPLFLEDFQAWDYGPVIPEVYTIFKPNEWKDISLECPVSDRILNDPAKIHFFNRIWEAFGQFSAWKLAEMTHQEEPWASLYIKGGNVLIPKKIIGKYFKQVLAN